MNGRMVGESDKAGSDERIDRMTREKKVQGTLVQNSF